jgi:hypothetical protein
MKERMVSSVIICILFEFNKKSVIICILFEFNKNYFYILLCDFRSCARSELCPVYVSSCDLAPVVCPGARRRGGPSARV